MAVSVAQPRFDEVINVCRWICCVFGVGRASGRGMPPFIGLRGQSTGERYIPMLMLSVLVASPPDDMPTLPVSSPRMCSGPARATSHDRST